MAEKAAPAFSQAASMPALCALKSEERSGGGISTLFAPVSPPSLASLIASTSRLVKPTADRHVMIGRGQRNIPGTVAEAENQHLRHDRADLPRREVDHRHDQPADQLLRRIEYSNLGGA